MKQSRFTDEQIIGFLKQADAGMSVKELCRSGGFSQPTFYKWRSRFGGMEPSGAANLRYTCRVRILKRFPIYAQLLMHEILSGMKIFLLTMLIAVSAHAADPVPELKYDPNSPVALAYKEKQQNYEREGQSLATFELYKELVRLDAAKKSRIALAKPEELWSAIFSHTDDDSRAGVYVTVLKKRGEAYDPRASFYYAIREWDICLKLQQQPGDGYKKMTQECWEGVMTSFKRASDAQIASASFNIARIYENGFGVSSSKFVAAEWYVKSTEQYNKQNDRDNALTALESALNLVPDHPAALRLRKVMLR